MKILVQKFSKNSKKLENNLLKIVKIAIIVFVSFSVLAHFVPFFEGSNSYYYGVASMLLIEEGVTKSNPFLEKYEANEFLVENWLRTDQNQIIPMSGNGLITLGGISYLFGGHFGLYYISPIIFIVLLVASERITTNLFGKYAGLITLLLLSTSNLLFRNSIQFHTESLFCLMFLLGTYCLIKFGRTDKSYLTFIASTCFVICTTVRLSGIISFPIEFFIIFIFIINRYVKNKKQNRTKNKNLQVILLALAPWIIFFFFFAYGNVSNFGDPLVMYGTLNENHAKVFDTSSFFLIEFEEIDFENVIQYSKYLLPYLFTGIFNNVDDNFESVLGQNWIGVIPLVAFGLIAIFSYKSKNKKLEIFVILLLLFGIVWFYSSITSEFLAEVGVPGRYVLPSFVLSAMIFGYAVEMLYIGIKNKKWKTGKVLQISLVSVIAGSVLISFYFTPAVTMFGQDNIFKNPFDYQREFPLKENGINENSILVTPIGSRALEYDLSSFNPMLTKQTASNSVNLLENLIREGNYAYTFKVPFNEVEKNMINSLINEYGFTLKDYSETFCKIELDSYDKSISDENCINGLPIRTAQT